jgi:hypothetical protein
MGVQPGGSGLDIFVACYASDGTFRWGVTSRGDGDEWAWSVAADRAGNVYVAGSYALILDLGAATFTASGTNDGFVASWTSDGAFRWALPVTGAADETAFGVATGVDAAGRERVYVTGWAMGTPSIFGLPRTSVGGQDGFLAVLDVDGTALDAVMWGGPMIDQSQKVAVGPDGQVYVAGFFAGQSTIGDATFASAGQDDAFVGWYQNQAMRSGWRLGGTLDDLGEAVAGLSGGTAIGGEFGDTLLMSGVELQPVGGMDGFVAAFDTDGTPRWGKRVGSPLDDRVTALASGPDGYLAAVGYFNAGAADIAGRSATSAGGRDAFVVVFDRDGQNVWTATVGGVLDDKFWGVAFGPDRSIVATGITYSSLTIGGQVVNPDGADTIIIRWAPP